MRRLRHIYTAHQHLNTHNTHTTFKPKKKIPRISDLKILNSCACVRVMWFRSIHANVCEFVCLFVCCIICEFSNPWNRFRLSLLHSNKFCILAKKEEILRCGTTAAAFFPVVVAVILTQQMVENFDRFFYLMFSLSQSKANRTEPEKKPTKTQKDSLMNLLNAKVLFILVLWWYELWIVYVQRFTHTQWECVHLYFKICFSVHFSISVCVCVCARKTYMFFLLFSVSSCVFAGWVFIVTKKNTKLTNCQHSNFLVAFYFSIKKKDSHTHTHQHHRLINDVSNSVSFLKMTFKLLVGCFLSFFTHLIS